MSKVWFITGAAKGIGNAIADAALKAGDYVMATTRKANDFATPKNYENNVLILPLDVSDTNQSVFDNVAKQAVEKFGRIDVLVNNAGYGSITFF